MIATQRALEQEKSRKKAGPYAVGSVPQAKSNGTPNGTRTITVPAILSCHDCLFRSHPAQKKPRKKTNAEKKLAVARIIAKVSYSIEYGDLTRMAVSPLVQSSEVQGSELTDKRTSNFETLNSER